MGDGTSASEDAAVVPKHADALLRDQVLLGRLEALKAKIDAWIQKHEFWGQNAFKTPFLHRNAPPFLGEGLLLIADGDLTSMFGGGHEHWDRLQEEFSQMLAAEGFWYEMQTSATALLIPDDDGLQEDFLRLYRWQWIQNLAERRLYDLHSESFEFFARDPERLKLLSSRQFEEFLDAVFRNQGFHSEIGPGQADGGIDHRLYQSEAIPEIVAVVQAKRYRDKPIGLEAVAALNGVAAMARAPRAIFATTSRYLPGAREFAANTQNRLDLPKLELADLPRLQEWCGTIAQHLDSYFQRGSLALPPIIANRKETELTGKIVVAHPGVTMVLNSFALIEADFPHEVILRSIGQRNVSGDSLRGTEVPDPSQPSSQHEPKRFVAFKGESFGCLNFWGNEQLYSLWDGNPVAFDLCD